MDSEKFSGEIFAISSVGCPIDQLLDDKALLTSELANGVWEEIPVDGIYSLKLRSDEENEANKWFLSLIRWPEERTRLRRLSAQGKETLLPSSSTPPPLSSTLSLSPTTPPHILFLEAMKNAVRRRLESMTSPVSASASACSICRTGVLFSGGIDSVFLAALLHIVLSENKRDKESIELVNVSFNSGVAKVDATPSPDRLASIAALSELRVRDLPLHILLNNF
jgi:hypothetical protein